MTILLFASLLLVAPGCDNERLIQFRDGAASGLQSGVNAMMVGLVDGLFAAYVGGTPAAE